MTCPIIPYRRLRQLDRTAADDGAASPAVGQDMIGQTIEALDRYLAGRVRKFNGERTVKYTLRAMRAVLACAVASAALTGGPAWADSATQVAADPATGLTITQVDALQARVAASGDKAALQTLMTQAQKGAPRAQLSLGVLYDSGQGVPQDYAQAAQWYRKAADQGNAGAQNNLGTL